jgi:hypothetical protein
VVNKKGVYKSLTVIIAPEIDELTARGTLSAMIIKPLVVARSFSVTISI